MKFQNVAYAVKHSKIFVYMKYMLRSDEQFDT